MKTKLPQFLKKIGNLKNFKELYIFIIFIKKVL